MFKDSRHSLGNHSRRIVTVSTSPVPGFITMFTLLLFLIQIHSIINTPHECVLPVVAATSFFPKTSSTNQQQHNTAGDKNVAKITSTQVNIATTTAAGLPQSTPIGFWSDQHGGLFIPQHFQLKSNKKASSGKGHKDTKYAIQDTTIGGLNLDWSGILHNQIIPTIGMESIQVIAERLTTSFVQPIWNTALKAMDDQLLSHISNTIGKANIARKTENTVAADPGDFLGEANGWSAYFDRQGTCLVYYFHKQTGVSQWEVPYPNYPIPYLNHQQIQMMKQKYEQSQQQLVMSMKDDNSLSNEDNPQVQANDIFFGIQNLMKGSGGSNKDKKEPDEKNRNNKPWWASVLDIVFEPQNDSTKEVIAPDNDSKNGKAKVENEQLPFFAAISDDYRDKNDNSLPVSSSSKSTTNEIWQSMDALSTTLSPWWDMLRDVVVKAATTTIESQATNVEVATVDNQPKPQEKKVWDFFFPNNVNEKDSGNSQSTIAVKSSFKGQSRPQTAAAEGETDGADNKLLGWMSDLPLFLTRDVSRTVPLFGLFPKKSNDVNKKALVVTATVPLKGASLLNKEKQPSHAERLKVIEEKRYAASRARQANLRKTYGTVIHDRSPTVSLTSIKLQKSKQSNKNIDWYKYLDD